MVPREILKCQAVLGPTVTLVWINLTALSQLGLPLQIHSLAEQMGLDKREVSQALALLADGGWINDEGLEIQLTLAQMEPAASLERVEEANWTPLHGWWSICRQGKCSLAGESANCCTGCRARFVHEVIAVAVGEMCLGVNPSFLSGGSPVVWCWHPFYNDLLENPYTKVLGPVPAVSAKSCRTLERFSR